MALKTEWKVGFFIILTVLLILAGLGYMAYKKGFFQPENTYTISSRTGDGLFVGMPLYFSGFKIGKIVDLELSDKGMVMIKITAPTQHAKWIRSDSKFVLEKPLFGSPKFSVTTTNLSSSLLSSNSIVTLIEVNDINDTIQKVQPILDKVATITDNIERLTGSLADPTGDMSKILKHSEELTGYLSSKKSILEMALGDEKSVQAIHVSLQNARNITDQVGQLLKKTDEELYGKDGIIPLVIKILRELVIDLGKIGITLDNVTKISSNTAEATKDLKLFRSEVDSTVNSLNRLINELDKKIPFKSEPKIKLP
jgi:phospholipid/cholesterol/gamma-HCH transport system substrate-binding protein